MGIGISIFLLAAGAILAFAVETTAEGVNLDTVGVILMVVGGLGLLFTLLVFGDNGVWRRRDTYTDTTADRDRVVYRDRERI
jgi:hypothetical protein